MGKYAEYVTELDVLKTILSLEGLEDDPVTMMIASDEVFVKAIKDTFNMLADDDTFHAIQQTTGNDLNLKDVTATCMLSFVTNMLGDEE